MGSVGPATLANVSASVVSSSCAETQTEPLPSPTMILKQAVAGLSPSARHELGDQATSPRKLKSGIASIEAGIDGGKGSETLDGAIQTEPLPWDTWALDLHSDMSVQTEAPWPYS